jgi:hypothetical protein
LLQREQVLIVINSLARCLPRQSRAPGLVPPGGY